MSSLVRQSTNSFIEELNTRINLLTSSKLTANIDNSGYEDLKRITSDFFDKLPEEIIESDLKTLDKKVMAKMLLLAGESNDSIEYLIGRVDEYPEFLNTIRNKIVLFAKEYKTIDDTQTKMIRNKIAMYQSYIDIFSKATQDEVFDELVEIHKILDTGFSDEIKSDIESYIFTTNLSLIDPSEIEFNSMINSKNEMLMDYLLDEDIVNMLETTLKSLEVDADLIPTIASELSPKLNIDAKVLQDLIAICVANNLYLQYESYSKEDQEVKDEFKKIIEDVLSFIEPIHQRIVYIARDIVKDKEDFLIASISSNIDDEKIYEYMETPISKIEEETNDRIMAIDLKELSVIKPIIETLNTIDGLEINSEEYNECTSLLARLVEKYKELERKKEEPKTRIN